MTRPTLASCVWTDGNLSWEGRYGASGVATLHSTLGVSAFPEFVSPMGGHPSWFILFLFLFLVLWHQVNVAWKSRPIPFLSQCIQWFNYSKPSRLSKDTQIKKPYLAFFRWFPDCVPTSTYLHLLTHTHTHTWTRTHRHVCRRAHSTVPTGPPEPTPTRRTFSKASSKPGDATTPCRVFSPGTAWWKPTYSKSSKKKEKENLFFLDQ